MSSKEHVSHNDHTVSKEQHPTPEQTENPTPLIHPSVLHRATERPHAARPETLLQLQRLHGNRAVGQMIARRASAPVASPQSALGASPAAIQPERQPEQQDAPTSSADQTVPTHELTPTPSQTGSLQRVIDMTFHAKVGFKAGLTNPRNIMFKEIKDTFEKYQKTSSKAKKIKGDPSKENKYKKLHDIESDLLRELKRLSAIWLDVYLNRVPVNEQRPNSKKAQDARILLAEATRELDEFASEKYLDKARNKGYEFGSFLLGDKLDGLARSHFLKESPEEQEAHRQKMLLEIEKLKKLTPGERSAITSYANEQYRMLNPAMAGDENWLKASLLAVPGRNFDTSPAGLKKAMAENKEIGELTQSGLHKLPNWKHAQTLYRGETFSIGESDQFVPGTLKKYPHFVSTSKEVHTPRNQIKAWTTKERPVAIMWHITKSEHGKDIASLHPQGDVEAEILFPANTTFQVVKVLSKGDNSKELEVHEV